MMARVGSRSPKMRWALSSPRVALPDQRPSAYRNDMMDLVPECRHPRGEPTTSSPDAGSLGRRPGRREPDKRGDRPVSGAVDRVAIDQARRQAPRPTSAADEREDQSDQPQAASNRRRDRPRSRPRRAASAASRVIATAIDVRRHLRRRGRTARRPGARSRGRSVIDPSPLGCEVGAQALEDPGKAAPNARRGDARAGGRSRSSRARRRSASRAGSAPRP